MTCFGFFFFKRMTNAMRTMVSLLIVVWFTFAAGASSCSSSAYKQDCLRDPDCGFCCSAPVGNQCFNRSNEFACPSDHIVPSSLENTTHCEELCSQLGSDCNSCVGLVWCYYCESSNVCLSPQQHCPDGTVMQSCGPPSNSFSSNSESDDKWFHVVMYTSLFAAGILIVLGAVIAGLRCRRGWTQRQQFRAEARPLLSPTNRRAVSTAAVDPNNRSEATEHANVSQHELVSPSFEQQVAPITVTGEPEAGISSSSYVAAAVGQTSSAGSSTSDSICQLCFDNDAVVAFLPCYHVHCCTECANRIRPGRVFNRYITCPFCRQKIGAMVRLTSIVQKKML